MAYLRIENKKSGSYLRIVKSYRKKGKVLQKTMFNLGKKEDYSPEQLKRIGEKLYELGGGNIYHLFGKNIQEVGRYNYGYFQFYSRALGHYGIKQLLDKVSKKNNLSFDLSNSVMLMLLERLHEPSSKRRNYFNQEEYLGIDNVELHHLYRSLDYLADNQSLIQDAIYHTGRNLFNQSLDVVFYDVTTFYFDTERKSELLQHGFGKDGKIGKSQIVFSLLIDKNKQPISYEIYEGSFYEGYTFQDAVNKLKHKYNIDKVIVVADKGMMNKSNLSQLSEYDGFEFVIGERLRNLPEHIIGYLTDRKNYRNAGIISENNEEINIEFTTIEYQGRKIIGTYSAKRAEKDRFDRAERIEKGKKLLKSPSQLTKKASRYYLEKAKQDEYKLNEQRIALDARFDGFTAIATNNKDQPETLLLDHYKHLYQIEHSFRSFKSHLETRPMFHWTDKRIEGHICLCYIAYTLNIYAINKLKENEIKMSENDLRRALDKMQVSHVKQDDDEYYMRSKSSKNIENIIETFKLKKIPDILPKSQLFNYL